MCASPFSFLRAGTPPPRIALLSDAVFFTRTVPVAAGATSAEVAAQVELALEALSPFPVGQLYHGHYWKPGLERAFVFAAYRRRFTSEETAGWAGAELVLPTFATVFGAEVAPATTLVLTAPEGLTAVHWESGAMPARVLFYPLPAEAPEEERARTREELLRAIGGSRTVIDLPGPPAAAPANSDDEIVFNSGTFVSRLPVAITAALDVRDKTQLAELRRGQLRDLWLWRAAMGCAAAILLFALGELSLWGAGIFWEQPRVAKLKAQAPEVEKIDNAQKLANRIEELTTKRLLPLEMVDLVRKKKPEAILLLRAATSGLQTLVVQAQTNNALEISAFKSALRNLPECDRADTSSESLGVNGVTSFTLTVTFKPGALTPETPAI